MRMIQNFSYHLIVNEAKAASCVECAFSDILTCLSSEYHAIVFHFDWPTMKIALRSFASSVKIDDNKFHIRRNYIPSSIYLHRQRLVHIIIISHNNNMNNIKHLLANVLRVHYTLGLA